MKSKANEKIFRNYTAAELEEMTKEFDREFIADTFHPMTPKQRVRWERAKRKSKSASPGTKTIEIKVDGELLKRTEGLAKSKGITRDALIDRALKTVLMADGQVV